MSVLAEHDQAFFDRFQFLIGVDEAGRGTLAGPVSAGAVMLEKHFFEMEAARGLIALADDSKKLSKSMREELEAIISELCSQKCMYASVAFASVEEIEQFNILGATRIAMQRAIEEACKQSGFPLENLDNNGMQPTNCQILVDGRPLKPFPYRHQALVKGDSRSISIALASILAKVRRDAHMEQLASDYPLYGFDKHAGYGTKMHRDALLQHGPCKEHRSLFLRKILGLNQQEIQKSFDF